MDDWARIHHTYISDPFSCATIAQLWQRLIHNSRFDKSSGGALHEAACTGDVVTIDEILDHKPQVDLDEMDENGKTALHLALRAGSPEIVRRLLEAGALPNPLSLPPPSAADALIILAR